MIAIVELGPQDWQVWRRVRLAALRDAPEAFGSTYAEWEHADEARWRARLTQVPLHALASVDGVPAGVVSVTGPGPVGTVELISMWVAPSSRGHGVGGALVGCAVEWARRHSPGAPIALQVRRRNAQAIALYERHGFVVVGENPEDELELTMEWQGPAT